MICQWRCPGSPAPASFVSPFSDVPSGAYYSDAVLWALEQEITTGADLPFGSNHIMDVSEKCLKLQAMADKNR